MLPILSLTKDILPETLHADLHGFDESLRIQDRWRSPCGCQLAIDHDHAVLWSSFPKSLHQSLKISIGEIDGVNLVGTRLQLVTETLVDPTRISSKDEHDTKIQVSRTRSSILIHEAKDFFIELMCHC
jgi:hypothetical protein